MTGLSSANFVNFVPIAYPRWPPQGNLVYHWILWEFHWKTFLWETTQQIEYFAIYECSLDGSAPDLMMSRINSGHWKISTDHHFQNGRHNTANIQHCPISSKFDMWVDYDIPNWFLRSVQFLTVAIFKMATIIPHKFNIVRFQPLNHSKKPLSF